MSATPTDNLSILLMGSPRILLNSQQLTFRSAKAVALLAFLSMSGQVHDRAELALLLWPDSDSKRARGTLRYTLTLLKQALGDDFLTITHHQVGLNRTASWSSDASAVKRLLTPVLTPGHTLSTEGIGEIERGIALYEGDFLTGFTLRDSENFNEWAIQQGEALQRLLATALKQVTAYHAEQQNWDAALDYGHRWLNLDPFYETAHCQLMQIYAATGQWTAVQNQYQSLVDLLDKEMGAPPQPKTEALYRQLCQKRDTAQSPPTPLTDLSRDQRSRQVLMEKMRRFWVNSLLISLREPGELIQLKLRFTIEVIDYAWFDIIDKPQNQPVTNIQQAFERADHALLILGTAGAGKTISLVALAETLLEKAARREEQPIPVILNLSTWAGREMSIAEWAVEEMVAQYQIPRRMGQTWLKEDRLLLLLDGLDEMSPVFQRDCIQAINVFRQSFGLADLVVCCRQSAYAQAIATTETRLQLNGAVVIQPLTTGQINHYVSPALAKTIFEDEALLEMAQSPLTLRMLRLALNEAEQPQAEAYPPVTHRHLFARYVHFMLGRQEEKGGDTYPSGPVRTHLIWLARQMERHNQSIFLIEQLQPSWLSSRPLQWLYLLLTRSVMAALLGTPIGWSFIQLLRINPPQIEIHFLNRWAALVGLTIFPWNGLLSVFVLVLITGLVAALVDGLFFAWRQGRDDEVQLSRRLGRLQLAAVVGAVCATATFLISRTDTWLMALSLGGMAALCFGLSFNYLSYGQSLRTEIRSRDALAWSWPKALLLGLVGVSSALLWSGMAWLQDPVSPRWQINLLNTGFTLFLLGGITGKQMETSNRPNQGIRIAGKNGLKAATLLAVATALLAGITVNPLSGLLNGALFGLLAGVMHGLNDVVKHAIIRLLLWVEQRIPFNHIPLLDYAANCALLRKVGGGYAFWHRLLLEHFADEGRSV